MYLLLDKDNHQNKHIWVSTVPTILPPRTSSSPIATRADTDHESRFLLVGIVDRRNTPPEDGHRQKQRQHSTEATASTNAMPPRTMEEETGWQH